MVKGLRADFLQNELKCKQADRLNAHLSLKTCHTVNHSYLQAAVTSLTHIRIYSPSSLSPVSNAAFNAAQKWLTQSCHADFQQAYRRVSGIWMLDTSLHQEIVSTSESGK